MEQLTITGNVGHDATVKSHNGENFTSFTVAVNSNYKNANGEKVEQTNWYNVTTKQANITNYLKKGTLVMVQGRPKHSLYDNKEGKKAISYDLRATQIELLSAKKD